MRLIVIMLAGLLITGCASTNRQTEAFFRKPHTLPEFARVEGVPFIEQAKDHCGPATLAMVMNWAGKMVTVDEITSQTFTPGMKGTFQADLVSASRRNGMLSVPIAGLDALLTEVAAGHPVVVFENLGLSWYPRWHYAVVIGYDLNQKTFAMHSGPKASEIIDMRTFEDSWRLSDHWGLVVLPPGKLSASANELAHVRATAALENLGRLDDAERSYLAILNKWPTSLAANIGAANIAFRKQNPVDALRFLLKATEAHPTSAPAWHNLAIAYGAANEDEKARESAYQAVRFASPDAKAAYELRLKKWIQ